MIVVNKNSTVQISLHPLCPYPITLNPLSAPLNIHYLLPSSLPYLQSSSLPSTIILILYKTTPKESIMGAKLLHSRPSRASARRLPPQQSAIQSFAKTTKSGARAGISDAKEALSSKKRKVEGIQVEISSSNEPENSCDEDAGARASKVARRSRLSTFLSTSHSSSSSYITPHSTSPVTSTESISPPTTDNSTFQQTPSDTDTDTDTAEILDNNEDDRPESYYDLTTLHSSFLTALSLHYAHNSPSTPADLNQLLPCIEKIWKKRRVERQDLQRLLYILESGPKISADEGDPSASTRFRIAKYGVGKTCLELLNTNISRNTFGPPFSEAELNNQFTRNLECIWQGKLESSDQQRSNIDFLRTIPLAPIHDSTTTFHSLRIGQQRLLDFQKGVLGVKAIVDNPASGKRDGGAAARARSSGGTGTAGRRNGLLQRIQNKQLKQTTLAPPPTKDAILRRSAIDLVEEVVGVLILLRPSCSSASSSLLSGEGGSLSSATAVAPSHKKPYRWNTIIQNIRDSLRCPISKLEAEACLDLLAQPSVAGDWISIVTVNRIKSVVLRSGSDISPQEIGMRVARLET
ncbi:hypothetical protein BDBG_02476 [Blastomyces gilchristii SLH14081]|uniref:DNA replication factor Cdt1 C-terminal domain-containing protein n=1 Tax=Blastomyces gilchristii (strain SLH14081) TaxID=559298 RepID=A0A179UDX8_BLAGS|nr:uncharacterized protein BDBG_02476 [Blastomyces gilchristii SLH14081]OAT06225.1 hypothetical protein BDBG_02476 [Blastomyces gilchristii SLH14081]